MSDDKTTGSAITGSSDASPAPDAQTNSAPVDWKASLPEDLRNDPSLSDIKDVGSMAKSYINGQKLIGKNRIALPDGNATDEEMSSFYSQIGRPEKSDGYKFGERPALPEGLDYDEAFESQFRDLSYKAGLTSTQAKAIYDGYHDYISKKAELEGTSASAQNEQWVNALKKDLGKAYDERIDLATRAVDAYGGDDLKKWLDSTGNGNNPMFVKLFAKIGEGIADGKSDVASARSFTMTPDQAKQEIARYNRDPEFMKAYSSGDHTGHQAAVDRMNGLYRLAFPDETPIQAS